jgi:hypothetical protein
LKTFLLFFLLPLQIIAQDVTGIWTGFIQTSEDKFRFELTISENKRKLSGYSLTVFTFEGIENIGVKSMKLKKKNSNIIMEDEELIFDDYTTKPRRVKLSGILALWMKDTAMMLDGSFKTRSLDFRDNNSYEGTIHLQKQNNFSPTRLTAKLNEMNLLNGLSFMQPKNKEKEQPAIAVASKEKIKPVRQKEEATVSSATKENANQPSAIAKTATAKKPGALPAADIAERKTEIIRSIGFSSDSLVLSLYDNGTIDGDTVSVVLNGNILLAKIRLTASPIKATIYITPGLGDSLQLVMYAENLGRIPPNTGLLVIQDGANRNEIRFAGDMQKSSAIILKRKR